MKKIVTAIFAMVLAFMVLVPGAEAAERKTPSGISYDEIASRMNEYISKYESGLASVETVVFDREGKVFSGCYGHTDFEEDRHADENTVYEWGSVSKLLVWVSVMQLCEEEKLDFQTDIRDYLPKNFLTKLQYENEKITMINLMNHNAGFQESAYENEQCSEEGLFKNLEEAVAECECYQAYHVGEHTAYSNWGTALAALIVERVSGMDYLSYVQEKIFKPLHMEHTSINPHISDNQWVKKQREKLKCYSRYDETKYNEDLGVCHSWVQLFPAGSVIGTIDDMAAFAQGFVADQCPFFKKSETLDRMLSATSYYGDSDIEKNCHGLWTSQFAVNTLGHMGNTGGCTSNLQFDPDTGLGIVVMTNEPGETMFCSGLAGLLYGDIRDSELVKARPVKDHPDYSGVFVMNRTIASGFMSASHYSGGFFISRKSDNPDMFYISGGMKLLHIGDKLWLQTNDSGMSMLNYETVDEDGNLCLEMMSTDLHKSSTNLAGTIVFYVFSAFGVGCIIALFIRLLAFLIRKIRKTQKALTEIDKLILIQEIIFGFSGPVLFSLICVTGPGGHFSAALSGIGAAILGIISVFIAGVLIYKIVKNKNRKFGTKLRAGIWSVLCLSYAAVIILFQLFDFIHC